MHAAHQMIFLGGAMAALCILAGSVASRFKAPLLLVFLGLGMLAGDDGPGGIQFEDFNLAYLLGSLALLVILFEGGLKTHKSLLKTGLWPAAVLATIGVGISAAGIGLVAVLLFHLNWPQALLVGAAVAPTDAAAVATLVRLGGVQVPARVAAILEMESGLNDPISVVLVVMATELVLHPGSFHPGYGALLIGQEMLGGAVIGAAGGSALLWLLRRLHAEPGLYPVLALAGAMLIFGGAQTIETSGFFAVYIAGFIIGNHEHKNAASVQEFFGSFSWAAQIGLFLLLGLLVTPHRLLDAMMPALVTAVFLILIVRPVSVFLCLLPFKVPVKEMSFISWVGLRGAAPIYLTLIPVLGGLPRGALLFELVFVVVVTSLVIQGWTVGLAARLLGFNKA